MCHAMALRSGVGAHGLWSVSRGLARGLRDRGEYKSMTDLADTPRRGDLDGRGNLSLQALEEYVVWFLDVCLHQVDFMASLFEFDALRERLGTFVVRDLRLRPEARQLVDAVYQRGEVARGDASTLTGLKERTARDCVRQLTEAGLLRSVSPKSALLLRFSAASADVLFPRLFLEV